VPKPVLLTQAFEKLSQLDVDLKRERAKGRRNTIKYLTWDYLDVYVATSMRNKWEFEETNRFVEEVFGQHLLDLPQVRWFDPTQAYCDNAIDKGLLESLMLKRAQCTIYMAQEGDTLGKDSELAATLAQGKPVVAYVRSLTGQDLAAFAQELERRPIAYFRQRLLTLLADGFFDKPDNRQQVCERAAELGLRLGSRELKNKIAELLKFFDDFAGGRQFQLISSEEETFRASRVAEMHEACEILAAVESRAGDRRADMIKRKHPLGMQVDLKTGVANGVLVVRTSSECAALIRGLLTRELVFELESLTDQPTGGTLGTILVESTTRSRFRVVTKDECLTNSFWNFYLKNYEGETDGTQE
jgi:hypothetical protein